MKKKAYAIALCSSTESPKLNKHIIDEFPDKKLILRTYEALGNYLQIAVGFGAFLSHDFSLFNFCRAFKLPSTQTHYALKILEQAGYIEYVEDPDNNSRLLFLINRDELYKLKTDKLTDDIIQAILRSYTGLFADYVYIDETLIATRTQSTHEKVYETLVMLSKTHVINYIPQKKLPQIIFTKNREETRFVSIPHNAYEERRERTMHRISKVIEYITVPNICRTRILLRYFGEKSDTDCRMCDVCLQKREAGLKNWEYNTVREAFFLQFKNSSTQSLQTLADHLPLDKDKNLQVIRFLLDHDERISFKDGFVSVAF